MAIGRKSSNCTRVITRLAAVTLVVTHVLLLAYAAPQHSPTQLEPAFLSAGLSHWEFGTHDLFRVNPPLPRLVAALPVVLGAYEADWDSYNDGPGSRSALMVGADFVRANGRRTTFLITIARWACIPFSVLGAFFSFSLARDFWRSNGAGLIALATWCFDPTLLAHGELVTADCAGTAFGLASAWGFLRWMENRRWTTASVAGVLMGLALCSKSTWIILFAIWPTVWLVHSAVKAAASRKLNRSDTVQEACHIAWILLLAVYLLNACYRFEGTFTRLGDFRFVSASLGGDFQGEESENRFTNAGLAKLPIPLPRDYVMGIDQQKRDFEQYPRMSYFRGEWRHGGWMNYYLHGFTVKCPHGTQILALIVLSRLTLLRLPRTMRRVVGVTSNTCVRKDGTTVSCLEDNSNEITFAQTGRWLVLIMPPLCVLALVSSQIEFNEHFRYVLPTYGFLTVFCGGSALGCRSVRAVNGRLVESDPGEAQTKNGEVLGPDSLDTTDCDSAENADGRPQDFRAKMLGAYIGSAWFHIVIMALLLWNLCSMASTYPCNLSYFNELAGGPENGHYHLLGSSVDWGQDLLIADQHIANAYPKEAPFVLVNLSYNWKDLGIRGQEYSRRFGGQALPSGLYLVSKEILFGDEHSQAFLDEQQMEQLRTAPSLDLPSFALMLKRI